MSDALSLHDAARLGDLDALNRLLAEGSDLNARDATGDTPLMVAARAGQEVVVRHLLKYGADVNAVPAPERGTPLRIAVRSGDAGIVRALLAHGADPAVVAPSRRLTDDEKQKLREVMGALRETFRASDEDFRKRLEALPPEKRRGLETDLVDTEAEDEAREFTSVDKTPGHLRLLMSAISSQSAETLKVLLEAGYAPDPLPGEKISLSPLSFAASMGTPEMVRLFLDHGAKPIHALTNAVMHGRHDVARMLLEAGADPNDGTHLAERPLTFAVLRGDKAMVELLTEHGAHSEAPMSLMYRNWSPEAADVVERSDGTDWLRAVRNGDLNAVRVRLQEGVDVNTRDMHEATALMIAADERNVEMARLLLDHGAAPNASNQQGHLALHRAVNKGNAELVALLIERGADIHAENKWGCTPLILAARWRYEPIVELLVEAGARIGIVEAALLGRSAQVRDFVASGTPVDYANEAGMTTLMGAAHSGDLDLVRELLDRGANVEARDRSHNTPLLHAAVRGHEETVRFLLKRGADIQAENDLHLTVTYSAVSNDNDSLLRFLLDQGAPRRGLGFGKDASLLHTAIFHCGETRKGGDWRTVRTLIEYGEDVNAPYISGETPLMRVIRLGGPADLVRLLLEKGAAADAAASSGSFLERPVTPLMAAADAGRLDCVELLLNAGADPNGGDHPLSALRRAEKNGFSEIADLLRARGADDKARRERLGLPEGGDETPKSFPFPDLAGMLKQMNDKRREERNKLRRTDKEMEA